LLFTANKAWIDIVKSQLHNGTIKSALIVAKDLYELAGLLGCSGDVYTPPPFRVATESSIRETMKTGHMDMYDEILISHDISDSSIKDFLSRHSNKIAKQHQIREDRGKMAKRLLVVVDMQHDFVDGSLGSDNAASIVPAVKKKIESWDGDIIFTMDTHDANYLNSKEGKNLPVNHCIDGTWGHEIVEDIKAAAFSRSQKPQIIVKHTFGSTVLPWKIIDGGYEYVEFVGLCTDICVVSNVLLTKGFCPEIELAVDPKCCAGVTPDSHEAALTTMRSCQITILE